MSLSGKLSGSAGRRLLAGVCTDLSRSTYMVTSADKGRAAAHSTGEVANAHSVIQLETVRTLVTRHEGRGQAHSNAGQLRVQHAIFGGSSDGDRGEESNNGEETHFECG